MHGALFSFFLQMSRAFSIFNLMLIYYKYPLKVWLTTCVFGTVLLYLANLWNAYYAGSEYEQFQFGNGNEDMLISLMYYFLLTIVNCIFLSFPCWLFFWWTYWQSKKRKLQQRRFKILVFASGLVAYLILICILYRRNDFPMFPGTFDVFFSYAFVLVIAMLSFKFNVKDRHPVRQELID